MYGNRELAGRRPDAGADRARDCTQGNSLYALGNLEGGVGGKFIQDRLWWFSAARRQVRIQPVPDTHYPDGSPGISEDTVKNLSLRLTGAGHAQAQAHRLRRSRVSKYIGHDMLAGYDPVTASRVWEPSKLYQQAQAKWTSTLTNWLLLEVGYAQYQAYRHTTYQPGIEPPYGTAEWFAPRGQRRHLHRHGPGTRRRAATTT